MTAKTKSDRLRRLLSHGFFAPELPPCFVSEGLARYRKAIFNGISALPLTNNRPNFYRYVTEPSWFYFPRFGQDDRRHGVPNPLSYLLLAKVVADNYVALRNVAKRSRISASPPVFDWSGSKALMRPSVDLRDDFRVDLSSRREEYVTADVRAFFHSIYTHSIPWAIYGKVWAKNPGNRGNEHFGNLLDLLSRNLQDGQTIGLPVGPDTSRFLAEVIASAIDEQLQARLGISGRDASRYVDDFTLSASDGQPGKDLIATLRQVVAHFELELNNEKSAVVSTSVRHQSGWKQAVRACVPRGKPTGQDMQRLFYEVGRLCEAHPNINIEKFAFSNARIAFVRSEGWRSTQSLIINAYRRNSTLISFLVEILILRQVEEGDVDLLNLKDFLDHRITALSRADRTGEIIWLLFLSIRLHIVLSETTTASIFETNNAMVALLAAVANSRQLLDGPADFSAWNASHDTQGLKSPMWLYAYETARTGIVAGTNAAFLQQDPYFALLLSKDVSFFDINAGFESIGNTLRILRNDNERTRRIHDDFMEDFDVEIDDYDDDDYDNQPDLEVGNEY